MRILVDDVGGGVASGGLGGDFRVEVIARILGFPVAERHAQSVHHRAVGIDLGTTGRGEFVLLQQDEIGTACPVAQHIAKGGTDHLLVA